jgi:hypothetical protein
VLARVFIAPADVNKDAAVVDEALGLERGDPG